MHAYEQLTSPELMDIPSLARSPVAPVLFSLSDPARSTKCNFVCKTSYSGADPSSLSDTYNICILITSQNNTHKLLIHIHMYDTLYSTTT